MCVPAREVDRRQSFQQNPLCRLLKKDKKELFICKIKLARHTTSEIVPAGHEAMWRVGPIHIAYATSWRCAWWNQGVGNVTTEQGKQKMKFHLAC